MPLSADSIVTPFSTTPDVRWFYQGPLQEEALARLHFLVERRCRLGMIAGGSGMGKTLLLEIFARQVLAGGRKVLCLSLLGLEAGELLDRLLLAAGSWPEPHAAESQRWTRLADELQAAALASAPAVILLDDAADASLAILAQVVRLVQFARPFAAPTIVLTADSSQLISLGSRLLELVELRVDLDAWELADTQRHIAQSLTRVGLPGDAFDRDAVCRLHELAGGIPRRINQLADFALLAARSEQLTSIDRGLVDAAFDELAIVVEPRQ